MDFPRHTALFRLTVLVATSLSALPAAGADPPSSEAGCTSHEPELFSEDGRCFQFGGWMSGGFIANAHGNRTADGNLPLGYNNIADGAVLNQLWVVAEKEIDLESEEIDWGFRIDYLFGADADDNQAFAGGDWDFGWNSSRDYGSAIPQMYGDIATQDWTVRLGYFLTPVGWEFAQSNENFFYTHSYSFDYGEPNTHSGFLATYSGYENLEISGGWVMGWDAWFENPLNASLFLGNVLWTVGEDTAVTWALTAGNYGDGIARGGFPSLAGDIYMNSLVLEHDVTDRLSLVLQHDFGSNYGAGVDNHQWYSLVNYLAYELKEDLVLGSRLELFRDEDGQRVAVNGAGPGNFYEATIGLNWTPWENVRVRPELRWDWFSGAGLPYDAPAGTESGTRSNQFTGGLDVVVTF